MLNLLKTPHHQLPKLLKRDHTLRGGILFGLDGYVIEMQARAMNIEERGIPWDCAVRITGMARGSITEALDRISGAFSKCSIPNPKVEILINLIPPDLPKDGTWLDLPLAVIMLQAAGYLPDLTEAAEDSYVIVGELGLHGEIRRVPGILSIAFCAKPGQKLIVPAGNEKESCLILAKPGHENCGVYPVSRLEEVIKFFIGEVKLENALKGGITFEDVVPRAPDVGLVKGQKKAKDAAYIAAAGGHNLLLIGPPGEGKSFLASTIPGFLPRLSNEEKVQLTKIYSAYGELNNDGMAVTRRPMRSIHHTASKSSIVGGGSKIPRPGEITLAHLGVLFLDEIAEFNSSSLEAMRQPMESGEIVINRVGASLSFPCRFTLVAAMNPCPCGYYGTDKCRCKPHDVKRYQKKLSGPILDRIDLQVELESLSNEERFAPSEEGVTPKARSIVELARAMQEKRFSGTGIAFNAAIPGGRVIEYCNFSGGGLDRYKILVGSNSLTTRSTDRLAKVARTVADLQKSEQIEPHHVDKASTFVIGGILRESF